MGHLAAHKRIHDLGQSQKAGKYDSRPFGDAPFESESKRHVLIHRSPLSTGVTGCYEV